MSSRPGHRGAAPRSSLSPVATAPAPASDIDAHSSGPVGLGLGLALVLTVAAAIKLSLLAALGPATFPDTGGYLGLAQSILDDPSWWREAGWNEGYAPSRLLRPYGYPLLVAGLRQLAGSGYAIWLLALQTVVSLACLTLVAGLARRLIAGSALRLVVVALCATSGFMLFDVALLTDSLYASLFVATFVLLAARIAGFAPTRPGVTLALGLGWAYSITLRDVGLLHSFLPLAGLILMGWSRRLGWRRTLAHLALFALPVAVTVAVVVRWNLLRTGHAFFSITGGINWLWPSVNMVDRGLANPFDCADAVCRAAQSQPFGRGMTAVAEIAERLWQDGHPDPVAFCRTTFSHFQAAVAAHPLAFLATMAGNLQFGHLADSLFNPLANVNELAQLHSAVGHRLISGTRELWQALRAGDAGVLPVLVLTSLLSALSAVLLAITFVGTPIRIWTALVARPHPGLPQERGKILAVAYLWLVSAAFLGSYCIVHMEMRHALPTVPLLLLAFGWTASTLRRRKA